MVLTRTNSNSLMRKIAVVALQCIYMQVVFGVTSFVLVSANYAWTGKPFDLGDALLIAVCGSFFPYAMLLAGKFLGDMPILYAKPKKLVEKEKKLAERWEQLEEEASLMMAEHRLENDK